MIGAQTSPQKTRASPPDTGLNRNHQLSGLTVALAQSTPYCVAPSVLNYLINVTNYAMKQMYLQIL